MALIEKEPLDLTDNGLPLCPAGDGSYTFLAVQIDGRVGSYAYVGSYRKS